jgi:hypothetical protein
MTNRRPRRKLESINEILRISAQKRAAGMCSLDEGDLALDTFALTALLSSKRVRRYGCRMEYDKNCHSRA